MPSFLILPLILALSSCASREVMTQSEDSPKWTPDTRVAHALIDAGDVSQIAGQVNFEQMPNSVIVTYHFEGLQPRSKYQMYLHKDQACGSLDNRSSLPLAKVRARVDGVAENTFKSEDVTVARGEQALAGDVIVIRTLDEELGPNAPAVACAEVRPQSPSFAAQ